MPAAMAERGTLNREEVLVSIYPPPVQPGSPQHGFLDSSCSFRILRAAALCPTPLCPWT